LVTFAFAYLTFRPADNAIAPLDDGAATRLAAQLGSDVTTFHGDMARTGVMPGPGPTTPVGPLWTFATGDAIEGSPAVVGDTVYIGSDALYAVDRATGTERWQFATGGWLPHRRLPTGPSTWPPNNPSNLPSPPVA